MRKNAYGLFLTLLLAGLGAKEVFAAGYEPLVHIPGLPEGGVIDISAYLVGIYNFLLSIVGIVSVIMLIIGGMRYITAAGNSGAVSDAKNTIWSAISGLLLAILSWVIVFTINPDVLYLRQPGAEFENNPVNVSLFGRCYSSFSGNTCVCNDGYTAQSILTESVCQDLCSSQGHCGRKGESFCIAEGSPKGTDDPTLVDSLGQCTCATGARVTLPEGQTSCHQLCMEEGECGYKFLAIKLHARHGYFKDEGDESIYVTSVANGDKLYELMLTNNGEWDAFAIDSNATRTVEDSSGNENEFTCALLITNEDGWAGLDEHMVYWVREGTVVGLKENLYKDIQGRYSECCNLLAGEQECMITWGECGDHGSTELIVFARYSYDVDDHCVSCNFADGEAGNKAYWPKRPITCIDGRWR